MDTLKLVELKVPDIILKSRYENGDFIDKSGRIIREIDIPSEIKSLFTESTRPFKIYKDTTTGKKVGDRIFYDRVWLVWEMTHKIMAGRTLKQKLGDISTDFFLEKFTDSSYANYFREFYLPLSQLLSEYAKENNLRIPEDICLFYKGGNLFRILLTHFVEFLGNEEYSKLMKNRSDADFQIFINPHISTSTFQKTIDDISVRVLYVIYKYREVLTKMGIVKHNTKELVPRYIEKIAEYNIPLDREKVKIATKFVSRASGEEEKSFRSDFLMNTFIKDNNVEEIAYTEEYSLLAKNPFFKIDKRAIDPSLYVSRNIANDFTTASGKRYLFELIRLKRNIRIEVFPLGVKSITMSVPSELIDVSIPKIGDDSLETMKDDIGRYVQLYTYGDFQFYGVTLDYLLYDLSDILFLKFDYPWEDPKYEKRFTRYFICLLLDTIVRSYSRRSNCNIKSEMVKLRENANILKEYLDNYGFRSALSLSRFSLTNKYLSQIYENCKKINKQRGYNQYRLKLLELLKTLISMIDRISEKIANSKGDAELKELYRSLFVNKYVSILGGNV